MAAFKSGDKVRLIYSAQPGDCDVGKEFVLTVPAMCYGGAGWYVREGWKAPSHYFAPLTDPAADQFIARIRKLATEPINDAPKVTVREGK